MSDHIPPQSSPTDESPPDWTALARYLAGEGTPEERAALRVELESHSERADLVRALGEALAPASDAHGVDVDVERALTSVRQRRDASPARSLAPGFGHRLAAPWRAAAAMLVLAAGAGAWYARSSAREDGTALATSRATSRHAASVGAVKRILLSDGTRVTLAPGSALDVAAGYGGKTREVTLAGEAFFVVVHDVARPFAVRAGTAMVRDLGTEFTIRADDGSAADVRVSVASGSVSLAVAEGEHAEAAELAAGDVGVVRAGRIEVLRDGASADDTAFVQGMLVWRNAPIERIRADMRRWYGVVLIVTDSTIARRHLSASFTSESASEALRVVAAALGGELVRRGDTAVVRALSPPRTAPR